MIRRPDADTIDTAVRLIGRDEELSHIRRLLTTVDGSDASRLLLVGEPGSGKSVLLDIAADEAARQGLAVLRCSGHESERGLVFAGLHELLRPVLADLRELPGSQAEALRQAFGLEDVRVHGDNSPNHRLLINLATLTLLSRAGSRRPTLVVVDDVQWLDLCSLDALTFVARRLAGKRVAILAGTRTDSASERFGREFTEIPVPPLDEEAAGRLLESQDVPPGEPLRSRILEQAAGNPLALVELARASAGAPADAAYGPAGLLPLTTRLERVFAERLAGLPQATRRALLFAAAADGTDLPAALHAASAVDPEGGLNAWLAAEEAGLVRLESGHVAFRHPLMRSAVYQAASFAERREVHLALAEALTDDPDRRVWHLAAATLAPDESIAGVLEATADRARRRGGYPAAAAALERAAQLTPESGRKAQRLLNACDLAMLAGRPLWVEKLATRVVAATDDPALLTKASLWAGWALAATTRQKAALSHLLPLAAATVDTAPAVAMDAIGNGTFVIYCMGDENYRRQALSLLARIPLDVGNRVDQVWTRAGCDPFGDRDRLLGLLERAEAAGDLGPAGLTVLGGAAWVLDETATAVRLLGDAMEYLRRVTTAGANATLGQALALAQFEHGEWEAAWTSAEDARQVATENGLDMAGRSATYVSAALLALRGETDRALSLIDRAVAGIDPGQSRALQARARAVRATVATAEGDHPLAYELLRGLFTAGPDPKPLHYHASYYGIGDLAAAAVRAGREAEAARVIRAVAQGPAGGMSARLALLVHRAEALLAPAAEAEDHFQAALTDPRGEEWPFERAVTTLEYGEWLRRRRRRGEAQTALSQALTVFRELGARPWMDRASNELRACGVVVATADGPPKGIDGLTSQQLQIVRLAAAGLTNRQIGKRLFLSPRTVGFHLYQAFPKLGVTARTQLRDVLDELERR